MSILGELESVTEHGPPDKIIPLVWGSKSKKFEVIGNYDNHYIAKILSSSEPGGVVAVKKIDCEEVHLGSYTDNNPITMITWK